MKSNRARKQKQESKLDKMKKIRQILLIEKAHRIALENYSVEDFEQMISGLDERIADIETGKPIVVSLEDLR